MPTASRFVAAICLAALAYVVSLQVMGLITEDIDFGYFAYANLGIGLVTGWIVTGTRAGHGGVSAPVTNGLTGMLAMVFWCLFVQGVNEMLRLALRNRFDGPFEAVFSVFEHMVEFGAILADPVVLATLFVGGAVTGLVVEQVWRRWP
jgi:hypothetical protein